MFKFDKKIVFFIIFIIIFIGLFCFAKNSNINDFDLINFYINKGELNSDNKKKDAIEAAATEKIEQKTKEAQDNSGENSIIYNDVFFISQAPFGEWDDPRQQDGCEEAVSIMAVYWALDKKLDKTTGKEELLKISEYQEKKYNSYIDTSVEDTARIILKEYFNFNNYEIKEIDSAGEIIDYLINNYIVIAPTNGRLLNNPYYTQPGPERHNILIIGYNYDDKKFITNDPGTRNGKNFYYSQEILFDAIIDYPSGDHNPLVSDKKKIIIIKK